RSQRAIDGPLEAVAVFRVHACEEFGETGARLGPFGIDAEKAGETSIGNDAVGGDVPVPGPDHLGGIESELEPSLARPEPGFGDLDVIDIGAGAEPSLDRAVRPHEGHRAAERPAP